jgi:hypothetical protein
MITFNESASYAKKSDVYVLYVDFSFIVLRRRAAAFMDILLQGSVNGGCLNTRGVPESFVSYLVEKKILKEKE